MLGRIRRLDRRILFALVACALLLRAAMPAGWMPSAGADGVMRVSVCTGMGAQTMWIGRDGAVHHGEAPAPGHHDGQPCAFGALGVGLDATPGVAVAPPLAPPLTVAAETRQRAAVGRGLAAPPPPATGPPRLI